VIWDKEVGMVRFSLIGCLAAVFSAVQTGNEAELVGTWKAIDAKAHAGIFSEYVKEMIEAGVYFEFSKDKVTLRVKDKTTAVGKYQTNERNIDVIESPKNRELGIFKIEKKRLILCFPEKAGGSRPMGFELTEMGQKNGIWILERVNSK
jgi:uncharacterized protein (TIGR03067 family)